MGQIVLEPWRKSTLAEWFETATGAHVLDWERGQFDNAVEDVFGFNAAQVGLPGVDYLRANRMPFRFTVGQEPGCSIRSDLTQLPIASSSLDLIVLPHVLEFCPDPHQVLREAERVLVPEGQIVIAGFNPLSLWGLTRLAGARRELPWTGEFIGLLRLRDWLKLLGFELNGGKFGGYTPPFLKGRWLGRMRLLERAGERWWPIAGGFYVIRAVKRVTGMRIVTPAWRQRRAAGPALVSVARRAGQSGLHVVDGNPLIGSPMMAPVPARARRLEPVREPRNSTRSERDPD